MTNISLREPEKLRDLDLNEVSEYLNGAAYMVCPDDNGNLSFHPLRLRLEDAHDVFMGLMEHYQYMKTAGVPESMIATSQDIRRRASEWKETLELIVEAAQKAGVHHFDERCGNVGVQTGFFILGMRAVLEARVGINDALLALEGKDQTTGMQIALPTCSRN